MTNFVISLAKVYWLHRPSLMATGLMVAELWLHEVGEVDHVDELDLQSAA